MTEPNGAGAATRARNWRASITTDQRWLVPDLADLSDQALGAVLDRRQAADQPSGVAFTPDGYNEIRGRLREVAEDAVRRGGMYSALLCVPFEGGALTAVATLLPVSGQDPDLEALVTMVATPRPGDAGRRQVDVVQVAAGPSVRVRYLADVPIDDAEQQIADTVQYWVPVGDTGDLAVLTFATTHLIYGDFFAELFDEVAATLELTVLN